MGNLLLSKLKGLLAVDTITDVSQKERTKQIQKLMDEVQSCKRLGWVRNKGGQVLADPVAIAQALEQHWAEVTTPGLAPVEDCAAFLRKLKLPHNFCVMARTLCRPVSEALVADALDRLNSGSSPRQDTLPARVYCTFHSFFIPPMMEISHHAFTIGEPPARWELGLINCNRKALGLAAVSKLRPIALQDVKKKWIMNIVSLQIEQIFQQLTHKQQVGCVKGRQMIHHILGVKGGFETLDKGVLVSFDFANAFPTRSHNLIQALLQLNHLPPFHIVFILSTLTAPYHFCVGRGVVPKVTFHPIASRMCFRFGVNLLLIMTQRSSTYMKGYAPMSSSTMKRTMEAKKENRRGENVSPCPMPALQQSFQASGLTYEN